MVKLYFRDAFRSQFTPPIPRSTFHRLEKLGVIPAAECRVGRRPAWTETTVKSTLDRLLQTGVGQPPATPRRIRGV